MENSLHNRNKKAKERKRERQQILLKLVDEQDFKEQDDIIDTLRNDYGIQVSQPTLSRDMDELEIQKNEEGYYKSSQVARKKFQHSLLQELLWSSNAAICPNVATYFIRTEEGKAQEIAYHLRKTFDDFILATNVGLDYIILFVDADNTPEELLELFED
jgi:transcriptional regulator of arginine metabolism